MSPHLDDLIDQLHGTIAAAAAAAAALEPQQMADHHQQLVALVAALRAAGAGAATLAGVRRRIERHFAFVHNLGRQIADSLERSGLLPPPAYGAGGELAATAATPPARPLHHHVG